MGPPPLRGTGLAARARFMAGLVLRIALRALPQRKTHKAPACETQPLAATETLIAALMTGKLDACPETLAGAHDPQGQSWFFIALEIGPLATALWFLDRGAAVNGTDCSGRRALEVVLQRAGLQDECDDHAADCLAILRALLAAGADRGAPNAAGQSPSQIARTLGLALPP